MIGEWRYDAACLGRAPLWDSFVDGETVEERAVRQERAQDVCETCPVKVQCLASVDYNRDEGVRGGIVLARLVTRGEKKVRWPREHGSERGFQQHYSRRDMPVCKPCMDAHVVHKAERKKAA